MATAFRSGQKFRFPGDSTIYSFISIRYEEGMPIILYADPDEVEHEIEGLFLSDLTHA
jgi:hypothetical protein